MNFLCISSSNVPGMPRAVHSSSEVKTTPLPGSASKIAKRRSSLLYCAVSYTTIPQVIACPSISHGQCGNISAGTYWTAMHPTRQC